VASTPDVSPQERHALRRAPGAVYTLGILGDGSGRMEEEARQRRVDAVADKAAGQCRREWRLRRTARRACMFGGMPAHRRAIRLCRSRGLISANIESRIICHLMNGVRAWPSASSSEHPFFSTMIQHSWQHATGIVARFFKIQDQPS
jgi:hypothetical protein